MKCAERPGGRAHENGENMERMVLRAPLARGVMLGLCMAGLVGCGGGSNVRSDPPPPAPSTPTPPVTPPVGPSPSAVADPRAHAEIINYSIAGADYPGAGVTIGVVSTGVDPAHADVNVGIQRFKSQLTYVDSASNDIGVPDKAGVGTDLARVAAGMRSKITWTGGLAWGADIVSARLVPDAANGSLLDATQATPELLSLMHQALIDADVGVMLNAWGTNFGDPARADAYAAVYRPFVLDHEGMVVVAAGDQGRSQPTDLAALPSRSAGAAALEPGWLTVAALDTLAPTRLASYSNACGDAAAYCLVAPGDIGLLQGLPDDSTRTVHGTAFAAAQVAGTMAAISRRFPYMSREQLRQVLLGSAVDLGAPGVDSTFGWGLLNYGRAMQGPSRLLWGDFEVVIPGGKHEYWTGDISGQAGIIVGSGGTAADTSLNFTGNNTFTGPLRVKAGLTVLVTDGSMAAPIIVEENAYLRAWNETLHSTVLNRGVMELNGVASERQTVLEGDVTNEGVLVNRDKANTILRGNLFLEPTGTFMVNALGSDPLRVKGRIEIDGNLHIAGLAEGYVPRSRTELLVGEGGITGRFAQVSSTPLIDATLNYDATTAWLDVTRIDASAVQGVSYTPTSLGSAQRIDQAFSRLDDLVLADPGNLAPTSFSEAAGALQRAADAAGVERSLDSLSGQLHDVDATFALLALDGGREAIEARLDAVGSGHVVGAWSHRLDDTRGGSAFDVNTQGWMLGFDQQRRDGVTVGASLSQTDGNAWHSQRFDRERNRQVDAQLYASWNLGDGGYLLGTAAFGHMQRWLQREVVLGDDAYRVSSDYAHRYGALSLQSGRRIPLGGSAITPYIGVQALQLARAGFSEQGASGFGLTSNDASMSATQALAGARWSHDWLGGATRWALSGRIEWQRLLSQSGETIQARFTGMDAWAPIIADGLDRDVGLVRLGLEAGIGRRSTMRVDLDSRRTGAEQWTGAMATWTTAY